MKYEEERQAQLEAICSKAQADFEARNRRHSKTFSAAFSRSEDPDSYQVWNYVFLSFSVVFN